MTFNYVEYNWFVAEAKKRRKKVRAWLIVPIVLSAICIPAIISSWVKNYKFAQSTSAVAINLDDLSKEWVEEHPYVKIQNGCFNDTYVKVGLFFEKEKYFLLETCNKSIEPKNKVIVKSLTDIYNEDDSGTISDHFYVGRLVNGLEGKTKTQDFIRKSFELKSSEHNIYMLDVNVTPTEVKKKDQDMYIIFPLFMVGFWIFSFYMRKQAKKNHKAWMVYFKSKYPQINID